MKRQALRQLAVEIVKMQASMRKEKLMGKDAGTVKPKKPRTPIPPVVRQRDRKNDFQRKPKHPKDHE